MRVPMKKKLVMHSLVAAAAVTAAAPLLAQYDDDMRYGGDNYGGWETIGRKSINGGVDFDRIQVRGSERFRKIRVCSVNRAFELRQMTARFANGSNQNFFVGMIVPDGRCTRAFDLNGRRRNINSINMTYSRVGWGAVRPQLIVQAR